MRVYSGLDLVYFTYLITFKVLTHFRASETIFPNEFQGDDCLMSQNVSQNNDVTSVTTSGCVIVSPSIVGMSQQQQHDINKNAGSPLDTPKRLHVSNIPFRFRDPDLRAMFGVSHLLFIIESDMLDPS